MLFCIRQNPLQFGHNLPRYKFFRIVHAFAVLGQVKTQHLKAFVTGNFGKILRVFFTAAFAVHKQIYLVRRRTENYCGNMIYRTISLFHGIPPFLFILKLQTQFCHGVKCDYRLLFYHKKTATAIKKITVVICPMAIKKDISSTRAKNAKKEVPQLCVCVSRHSTED